MKFSFISCWGIGSNLFWFFANLGGLYFNIKKNIYCRQKIKTFDLLKISLLVQKNYTEKLTKSGLHKRHIRQNSKFVLANCF